MADAPTVTAISGSLGLLRRRALNAAIGAQKQRGWRITSVDGAATGSLRALISGGGFFEGQTLVVVYNPEKADLSLIEQHQKDGSDDTILLLYLEEDPKGNTKLGKFLAKLGKLHKNFSLPDKEYKVRELAREFCVSEAKAGGKLFDPAHADALLDRVGLDFGILSFEILKMVTLAKVLDSPAITPEIMGHSMAALADASLSPLTDAVAARDKIRVLAVLNRIKKTFAKDPVQSVCGWLSKSALDWLAMLDLRERGVSADDAAEKLSINPWLYKNILAPKIQRWTKRDAVRLVQALAESQRAVLNGHAHPWVGLVCRLLRAMDAA